MKANELRIGNYILFDNDVYDVRGFVNERVKIHKREVYIGQLFKPIPLTEEWLLKFGFSKWKNKNNFSKGSFIVYTLSKKGFHFGKKSLRVELKYVHQLQNLYFALTGEELKIKNNE